MFDQDIFVTARSWVYEAGHLIKRLIGEEREVRMKTDHSDLVTEVDMQVEQLLVRHIRSTFPDHAIIGEENVDRGNPDGVCTWIIDPIDGTANLVNRKQDFAVSVALCDADGGRFGLVYDVMNDRLFHAVRGEGAFVNEKRLAPVQADSKLEQELMAIFIPWGQLREDARLAKYLPLIDRARGIRTYGAATIELCDMARGLLGAYVHHEIQPWDYAASRVILEQLGCTFSDLNGHDIPWTYSGSLVAAAPHVHAEIIEVLRKHGESDAS